MRDQAGRLQELAASVDRYSKAVGGGYRIDTAIEGLTVLRSESGLQPFHFILKPAIWITIQGKKWAAVGRERYDYQAGQGFIVTVEVPCRCTVTDASPTRPFLGLVIEIDRILAQEVFQGLGDDVKPAVKDGVDGAFVLNLSHQIIDCALRGVRLLDTPEAIPVLYPGIMREVCYWLLTGPGGDRVARIATAHGRNRRVIQAIRALRGRFREPIRVEDLAGAAGMSPATFHRQFKAATSLSPVQYQKQLRLLEARRLLIAGAIGIEAVALEVGYESVSQFGREYARMFGRSPGRDVSDWQSS